MVSKRLILPQNHTKRPMIVDILIFIFLFYQFFLGWQKGLLETILGPISFIVSSILAYLYYLRTNNFLISLLVSLIGPVVIQIVFSAMRALNKKDDKKGSEFSLTRLLAGTIHGAWNFIIVALVLILIAYIPSQAPWVSNIQKPVLASKSYQYLNSLFGNHLPKSSFDPDKTLVAFKDPAWVKEFQSTPEYQSLISEPKVQAILSDTQLMDAAKNKNYKDILTNPKIQTLFRDRKLLEKFMALNQKAIEAEPNQAP